MGLLRKGGHASKGGHQFRATQYVVARPMLVECKRACRSFRSRRLQGSSSGEARAGAALMKHGRPGCRLLRTLKRSRMQAQDRRRYTAPEGASALAYEEDGEQQPVASTSAVRLDGRQPSQVRPICAFLQARGWSYVTYTDKSLQICKPDWSREPPDRRTSRLAGPSCFAPCMSTTTGSLYLGRS